MITVPGIVARFLFGGAAVALSAVVAAFAGGRIGGIFAAFPAVYLSAAIVAVLGLPQAAAAVRVVEISNGAFIGMVANIVCAACASVFIRRQGVAKGLGIALVIWLVFAGLVFFTALSAGFIN